MRRREGARWRDEEEEEEEEELRREEAEREGGRGRWEGVIVGEEEGWVRNGGGGAGVGREGRAGRWGDGRLGGGERAAGGGKGEETEVRFKGRGSMKYRERRW